MGRTRTRPRAARTCYPSSEEQCGRRAKKQIRATVCTCESSPEQERGGGRRKWEQTSVGAIAWKQRGHQLTVMDTTGSDGGSCVSCITRQRSCPFSLPPSPSPPCCFRNWHRVLWLVAAASAETQKIENRLKSVAIKTIDLLILFFHLLNTWWAVFIF